MLWGKKTPIQSAVWSTFTSKADHIYTDKASKQPQTWKSTALEEKIHIYYLKISRVHLAPGDVKMFIYRSEDNT